MIAELTKRYSVIAPLAPGFNDLDEIDDIDKVHDLALHYDALFDALGLDRITLVGHSFGAMIAAEICRALSARVEKLVLLSPFGLWRDDHPVADLFSRPYATFNTMLWKTGKPSLEHVRSGRLARTIRSRRPGPSRAGDDHRRKIHLADTRQGLRRRLHRVTAKTLVVFGADDAFVPAIYGDEFANAIRGASKAVIADAAHMVPYEKTSEVMGLIEQQLGEKTRAA